MAQVWTPASGGDERSAHLQSSRQNSDEIGGEGVLGTAAGKDKATGTSHRASPGSSHAAGGCTPAHPHSHTSGRASPSGPGLGGSGRLTPPSPTGRRLREEWGLEPALRVEYTTAFKVTGGSHSSLGNPRAKETGQERREASCSETQPGVSPVQVSLTDNHLLC